MTRKTSLKAVAALVVAVVVAGAAVAWGATNKISTVAGNGTAGFSGDGGPATAAKLGDPVGVAATADGGFLIVDQSNQRVRKVSRTGTISTVAGNGTLGFSGDGGAATSAELHFPAGVAATADGGFLIADYRNQRVRKVSRTGTISTVAGNGTAGYSGDGGPATAAELASTVGVAATADGGFLIVDQSNHVRKVSPTGTISTVAGNGTAGFSGDGGAATAAKLGDPDGVEATADGGFLIADYSNQRVRKVSRTGTISTVAGNGTSGFSGDGGAATAAELNYPAGVAATADGGFLIADFNDRVRKVSRTGTISTVAGNGTDGSSGDGGPATAAELAEPVGVSLATDGDYLIAETVGKRVRRVDAGDRPRVSVPPAAPSGSAPPVVKPRFSKVSLSPKRPRVKRARKAKLSFRLNVAERVTVRLYRYRPGRRSHKKCVRATRRNRHAHRCKRAAKVSRKAIHAKAAKNTIRLGKVAGHHKLRRGRYLITLMAKGATTKKLKLTIRR